MAAEYEGKVDRGSDGVSKTFKVLPRPLTRDQDKIRALNLTGTDTGLRDVSFNDGMYWQGLDDFTMHELEGLEEAIAGRMEAIDAAWYD
jgi:hypothetical protein